MTDKANRTLVAVRAMSLPILSKDGNPLPSGKEYLVRAGDRVEMLAENAEAALHCGAARELTDEESQPTPEPEEGSDVNGDPLTGKDPANEGARLDKPAANAKTEDWRAFAKQEGLSDEGSRDEIRARVEAAEKLEAQ